MRTQASSLDPAIHPVHKALVLVEALGDEGVGAEQALAGSGLQVADLSNPAARMSARQLLTVCRNCMALARDPVFALRAGRRVHATHLGFFGFALLSAATSREGLECLHRYRLLSTPILGVALDVDDLAGRCVMTYFDSLDMDEALLGFVLDFQMGVAVTMLEDTLGDAFSLDLVRVVHPGLGNVGEREGLLGAPIVFGAGNDQLIWNAAWLDRPQRYANALTAKVVREICDQLLAAALLESGAAGAVARMLEERSGGFPGVEEIAARMHMTSRTLRRKLAAEGTSFAEILASVRKQRAIRYLRTTRMKTDEIAEALGFSDVANFRHAFRRWTDRTPSDYRPRVRGLNEVSGG